MECGIWLLIIMDGCLLPDIHDSEIPGYQSLRNDRNRHGGGILTYVLLRFTVKLLPFHSSLELLTGHSVKSTQKKNMTLMDFDETWFLHSLS